jgi:hypothetical protein
MHDPKRTFRENLSVRFLFATNYIQNFLIKIPATCAKQASAIALLAERKKPRFKPP